MSKNSSSIKTIPRELSRGIVFILKLKSEVKRPCPGKQLLEKLKGGGGGGERPAPPCPLCTPMDGRQNTEEKHNSYL